jgi:hypothetical protein
MNIVFTICSNNYLAQAITLGNSLLWYNPDYKFIIGLVDRINPAIDYSIIPYEILEVEEIGISAFDELYKKYNIIELNTAVKPFYFQYLFANRADVKSIIFLDPDILVYSPFAELEKELETSDIIIIPHITTPLNDDKLQTEEDFLNSGLYNLGFIAVNNTPEGCKMINWWAERLRHKAYIDLKRGLFTDQIWINFVPLFYNNVKILNHQGYNMAYWNLHERSLSLKQKQYYVNDIYPLVFYHFSGFNPMVPGVLSKYQNRFTFEERPEILLLFEEYSAMLFLNNYKTYINYPNVFRGIKEALDNKIRKERIHKVSFLKRAVRIIILKIIKKFQIVLDYDD